MFSFFKISYGMDSTRKNIIFYILCAITLVLFALFLFFSAPSDFPSGSIINIEGGTSLRKLSLELKEQHIIRSRTAFETFAILYGGEHHIIPGDYFLRSKLPVYVIASRISRGETDLAPIKLTIPEGFSNMDIASASQSVLSHFNKDNFLLSASGKQGYLFPDTYFFFSTANEGDVFKAMTDDFKRKIATVHPDITSSGKKEKDIITMASIIEKEANGVTDRGIISGISWRRLSIGMPLQVDSAPETYKTKGLPKEPISNPGLLAIKAAIYPENSNYLYYLHAKDGSIHYAKTFEEHKANKLKYLQ